MLVSVKKWLIFSLAVISLFTACRSKVETSISPRLQNLPPVILWAWERKEDLEFIDTNKYGVAFLAQTLLIQKDELIVRPRYQPLKVKDETFLIAVTRIESQKVTGISPALSDAQQERIVERVLKTLEQKNVRAIQIDFDAAVSEREFYRRLLENVRKRLPENVPLSITALASFCIGDRWLRDLPVDEAVPMIFDMGADSQKVRGFLANNDFNEPLCRKSYGIATYEPLEIKFDKTRRIYVFNNRGWTKEDLEKFNE